MTFPLVSLPKRALYVDDKAAFLEALRKVMPRSHAHEFLTSPIAAIDRIDSEMEDWKALESLLVGESYDPSDEYALIARVVTQHFGSASRFNLTSVLIVDYSMPGLTGLDLIRRLKFWPGRRVLLTGDADAGIAISAFNEGLIQRFIPKSTNHLYHVLKSSYDEMHAIVSEQVGHLLRPTLQGWQKDLVDDDHIIAALNKKINALEWTEYVLVAKPFGLLGMSHSGPLQWLQFETSDTQHALSELAAFQGFEDTDVRYIREGIEIANCEIHQALNLPGKAALGEGDVIAVNPDLRCAIFDLNIPVVTAKSLGLPDYVSPIDQVKRLFITTIVKGD